MHNFPYAYIGHQLFQHCEKFVILVWQSNWTFTMLKSYSDGGMSLTQLGGDP